MLRKFLLNYVIMGGSGMPNLAINAGTQTVLDVWFRWSGAMAVLAYFVGLGLSMTYSNFFQHKTNAEFTVFGRTYRFSWRDKGESKEHSTKRRSDLDSPNSSNPEDYPPA